MANCPAPNSTQAVDLRNPVSCLSLCNNLLQAYYRVLSGQGRVTVRFQERWTEYQKGNVDELKTAYMQIYNQCPAAAAAGLPNLNASTGVRRGAPSRGFNVFPRL